MCVCILCACVLSKTVNVSIPDAGSTMEPEQRDVSRGLSAADISAAAGLNASGGVHKVKDETFRFILTCLLLILDCWEEIRAVLNYRNC